MKLISLIFVAASLLLGGCANQHYQNMAEGTLIGGAVGALLGDSSRATRIGAGVGLLAGAAAPVRQQYPYQASYGQPYPQQPALLPPGASCNGGYPVIVNGQLLCRHDQSQMYPPVAYPSQTLYPYGYPQTAQPMPYGTYQADPRTCPRVQLPGGRWRCQ